MEKKYIYHITHINNLEKILSSYVPFYFAPRSPMLFSIHKSKVDTGGQKQVIYLVTTPKRISNKTIPFCFTDGHGIMKFTEYYSELKDLTKIDWNIMKATYWNDNEYDNDRKRRRMAEFLVYNFVPIECFIGIGVYNEEYRSKACEIVDNSKVHLPVRVKSDTG